MYLPSRAGRLAMAAGEKTAKSVWTWRATALGQELGGGKEKGWLYGRREG